MSSTFLQEYNFLKKIIQFYINALQNAPSGNNGGNLLTTIQFDATARSINNVLLNIEGVVAFIYYNVYQQSMPPISGSVSQIQATNIYSIYDALGSTRPILNII